MPVGIPGRDVTDHSEPSSKLGFFAELRRRNVFRAAAIYIAAVWALSQGIAQLLPVFNAPGWIARWFVIACAIGFPFWIAFAWFFEYTPSGFKREHEIVPGESITRKTGRRLDFWIIGVLVVALVLLITNQFVLRRDVTSVAEANSAKAIAAKFDHIPFKSVAVLPLANESGDPKQQYFSDGLSEELISDLTQLNDLKVIGKYSSFKFRDSKDSPAQIGAALGVAHLVEGSVRQQGNRIRVTVNMIRAKDGASVWSKTYDEQLKDVFAIQSKIGDAVATALKVQLLGKTLVSGDQPPSGNVEAYRLMLQGYALVNQQTEAGFREGIDLLERAVKLDPKYAYAWGVMSAAFVNRGLVLSGDAREQAYAQARVAADKQQLLAPEAATTHMNRGYLLATVDKDPVGSLVEFRRALELAPNDGRAMVFLAFGLVNVGQLEPAAKLFRKAIATDPLRAGWYAGLASSLLGDRQLDAAEKASRRALALQPDFPGMYANLALIDILRGDAEAAARHAAQEAEPVFREWTQAMAQQISPDRGKADASLRDYIAKHGKTEPYFVADLYAARKQPDKMFEWLDRARDQHDPAFSSFIYDPFTLAYKADPRFAALRKRAGLSVPGSQAPASATSTAH